MSEHESHIPLATRARPAPWRQVALGLAILLCGMVMGAAGTMVVTRRALRHGIQAPDKTARSLTQRMNAQLNLSPEQQKQVAEIVCRHLKQLRATRKEQLRLMRDEVAGVLSPEQAALWRKGFDRLQRSGPDRAGGRHSPRGPRHPGDSKEPRSSLGCPSDGASAGAPPRSLDGLWF